MFWRQGWLADQLDMGSKWRVIKDDQSLGSEQLVEWWYDLLKLGRLERKKQEFTWGHETIIKHLTGDKTLQKFCDGCYKAEKWNKSNGHRVFVNKDNSPI